MRTEDLDGCDVEQDSDKINEGLKDAGFDENVCEWVGRGLHRSDTGMTADSHRDRNSFKH